MLLFFTIRKHREIRLGCQESGQRRQAQSMQEGKALPKEFIKKYRNLYCPHNNLFFIRTVV